MINSNNGASVATARDATTADKVMALLRSHPNTARVPWYAQPSMFDDAVTIECGSLNVPERTLRTAAKIAATYTSDQPSLF